MGLAKANLEFLTELESTDNIPAKLLRCQVEARVHLRSGRPREACRTLGTYVALTENFDLVGGGAFARAWLAVALAWSGATGGTGDPGTSGGFRAIGGSGGSEASGIGGSGGSGPRGLTISAGSRGHETYAAASGAYRAQSLKIAASRCNLAANELQADGCVPSFAVRKAPVIVEVLTLREREVAMAIAERLSQRAVAEALGMGIRTVETHLHRAYRKLGVTNTLELRAAHNR